MKSLYSKVPAGIKWVLLVIIASIVDHGLFNAAAYDFLLFTETPSYLHQSWTFTFLISIIVGLLILISYGLKSPSSVDENSVKPVQSKPSQPVQLKKLNSIAYLATYYTETLIWDVTIKFTFDDSIKPRPKEFVKEVYISDLPLCKNCGTGLYVHPDSIVATIFICANNEDNCNVNITEENMKAVARRGLQISRAGIIKDYDKYWNIYKNELARATDGKPEEYDHLWNKHKVISKSKSWLD